jgi:hypothetical protein
MERTWAMPPSYTMSVQFGHVDTRETVAMRITFDSKFRQWLKPRCRECHVARATCGSSSVRTYGGDGGLEDDGLLASILCVYSQCLPQPDRRHRAHGSFLSHLILRRWHRTQDRHARRRLRFTLPSGSGSTRCSLDGAGLQSWPSPGRGLGGRQGEKSCDALVLPTGVEVGRAEAEPDVSGSECWEKEQVALHEAHREQRGQTRSHRTFCWRHRMQDMAWRDMCAVSGNVGEVIHIWSRAIGLLGCTEVKVYRSRL